MLGRAEATKTVQVMPNVTFVGAVGGERKSRSRAGVGERHFC